MRFRRSLRVLSALSLGALLLWAAPASAQGELDSEPPMHQVAPGAPAPAPAPAYDARYARGAVGDSFYNALSPYGRWHYSRRHGWVWTPHRHVVGAGFRPYVTAGDWAYSDEGWMFVSHHPWGWAPYHYGRWYHDRGYGWTWRPGSQWAPAWVDWRYGDGYVGWAPLSPAGLALEAYWAFVGAGDLGRPSVHRYVVPRSRVRHIYRRMSRVQRRGRRWSHGPPLVYARRYHRRPIRRVRVRAPGAGVVMRVRRRGGGRGVVVHRPGGRVHIRRHHRAGPGHRAGARRGRTPAYRTSRGAPPAHGVRRGGPAHGVRRGGPAHGVRRGGAPAYGARRGHDPAYKDRRPGPPVRGMGRRGASGRDMRRGGSSGRGMRRGGPPARRQHRNARRDDDRRRRKKEGASRGKRGHGGDKGKARGKGRRGR